MEIEAARELVRMRVKVTTANGELIALLRAVTPGGALIVADHGGMESWIRFDAVTGLVDERFTCAECNVRMNVLYADGKCHDCYRFWAASQPVPQEQCEEEGCATRAFYSPAAKVFRCAHHHAKYKTFSGQGVELRVIQSSAPEAADCRADDVDSLRHDWKRFRSQWLCRKCQIKHFGRKPDGAEF